MSSESFKTFLAKLENDAGLRQELRAAGFDSGMPPDAVIAFAARKGYVFTIEDGELTDQQLDAVAGGGDAGGGDTLGALELQEQMQNENRSYTRISNIMKTKHDTVRNAISNVR